MKQEKTKLNYSRLFWLFIIGSLIGVVIEGLFCAIRYGRWETHVVSVWGPFCILYGFGAAGCYIGHYYLHDKSLFIQFITYSFVGFIIELICGLLLEFGLGMRAWDYTKQYLNIRGHVSLQMSLGWGVIGILFSYIVPYINGCFEYTERKNYKLITILCSLFMCFNLLTTGFAMARYSSRHYNKEAHNKFELMLDSKYDDNYMRNRFMEWRFLDEICDKYD